MILIIESVVLCLIFTIMVYIMSRDPIKTLYNYPPKIQERVKSLDEYKDIARKVYELLIKKEYQQLKQYLVDQYPTKEEVNFRKVDITIEILINILEE